MHLITMAHLGEAQGVIEKFHLQRITPELFKNEEMVLLLTGEGPFEAATKTALLIPRFPFTQIMNLGIAGSLKGQSVGEIYPVRTLYLIQDLKPSFKSFGSQDEGLDCLTSFERILDPQKAIKLKGLGHLVDREGWGVAMAAKTAGIPFTAFKIISDVAGTIDACEIIKDRAHEFSEKLASFLETYLNKNEDIKSEEKISLPGFHFTFSTNHQLKNLLNKLSIKEQISEEDLLATLPLEELKELKLAPKERARRLLDHMENRIDPLKAQLARTKEELQNRFQKQGLKLETDGLWENPKLTISFEAGSDQEILDKIQVLKTLSIDSFTKIMNGEICVE